MVTRGVGGWGLGRASDAADVFSPHLAESERPWMSHTNWLIHGKCSLARLVCFPRSVCHCQLATYPEVAVSSASGPFSTFTQANGGDGLA